MKLNWEPLNRSISTIRPEEVPNFNLEKEFSKSIITNVDANVLYFYQALRNKLPYGLIPSPLEEAWFRTKGSTTSRHFIKEGQLSLAGDMFIDRRLEPLLVLSTMLALGANGAGVYLDTFYGTKETITPMLHFDLRGKEEFNFWIRTREGNLDPTASNEERGKIKMIYPMKSKEDYLDALKAIDKYKLFISK